MTAFIREAVPQHDDIDGVPSPAERERIVGHPAQRAELAAAAQGGRLHHAWLLQGPRGIGKASVAYDFARALLVGNGDPGGIRQIAQGAHPNLLHIARGPADRGGFRTQITVDEVRRLNHFFQTTAGGRWRIAIIDPAEDMNRNAANALLKILEEPPARCVFLIVNHLPGRLLPTIRSRCRVLRFEALDETEVADILAADLPETPADTLSHAARRAEGSARAGFMMIEGGGLEVGAEVERLYAQRPDWAALQKLLDALTVKGREAAYERMLTEIFRLLAAEASERLATGDLRRAAALSDLWSQEQARWREAAAFNLDRKQVALTFFRKLEAAREAGGLPA
ncbi:DNA polymerase III subunit delta' [Aureimonas mangrovi]|uniref:DNA polymerase III subunit delta' n=1 Tax=Aureimonas mangrovi TaxID=2758041 RepID=UPI00163DA84E|nr:DNA polymerase III subunit delta' [Aureimonas mangrovi]